MPRVRCGALMEEVGWAWTVDDGWNVLVGADGRNVIEPDRVHWWGICDKGIGGWDKNGHDMKYQAIASKNILN